MKNSLTENDLKCGIICLVNNDKVNKGETNEVFK